MRRIAAVVLALCLLAPVHAGAAVGDVAVELQLAKAALDLGESVEAAITVTNNAAEPMEDLVVHIDITDPSSPGSVDPEDWTATLSKPAGPIAPGAAATVRWSLIPVSGGRFSVYAVVLRRDADGLAASQPAVLEVTERRVLNPRNILPVALAVPLVIAGLLALQRRSHRSARRPRRIG